MTDCDAATPLASVSLTADLVEMHPCRIEIEIEMEVDVEVVARRQFENACNLAMRIAIHIGNAADRASAQFAGFDEELVAAGIVQQSLLRKHT